MLQMAMLNMSANFNDAVLCLYLVSAKTDDTEGSDTQDFRRRDSESLGILAWFQDSWLDSYDSCLPN